jgi:hypothetical protein
MALGWKIHRAREQRQAVEALKLAGALVFYDYQFQGEIKDSLPKIDLTAKHRAPDWLRKLADDAMFQEVTSISFQTDNPSVETWNVVSKLDHLLNVDFRILDARLEHVQKLRSLPRLKSVTMGFQLVIEPATLDEFAAIPGLEAFHCAHYFSDDELKRLAEARHLIELDTHIRSGDQAMAQVVRMSRLQSITLKSGVAFTNASLKTLAPILPQLEVLNLQPTSITDEGMAELSACRRLKSLKLDSIFPSKLSSIKDLKQLETISMTSPSLNDDSLVDLKGLVNLKTLDIQESKIGNAGLEHLTSLKKLERLELQGEDITDDGLASIRKLPSLKELVIHQSWMVTPEALATIRQDLPDLKIDVQRGFRFVPTPPTNVPPEVTPDDKSKADQDG